MPGVNWPFDAEGENIAEAIETARGPDNLMIPIPPRPPGVAIAAMVALSIFIVIAVAAFACYFSGGK